MDGKGDRAMKNKKKTKYYLMTEEKKEVISGMDEDVLGDRYPIWETKHYHTFYGTKDTLKEAKDWAASLILKSGEHPYAVKGMKIHFTIEEKTKKIRKAIVRK